MYPQVIDESTLTGVFNSGPSLDIGIEGRMDNAGSAPVGLPVLITSAEHANSNFGPASSLAALVKFILNRGIESVLAVASAKGSAPDLTARRSAWASLEENADVRIRLTDATDQSTLVALGTSCGNADEIQHKQFAVVGLSGPAVKATAITAAGAINHQRVLLVDPGIFDLNGDIQEGAFAAAYAACEIAKNPDITDSLNLAPIPATAGIERQASTGLPVYRVHANAGSPVDDFQDLLDGGVSPFQQSADGRAAFTHLRMTFTDDDTYDSLMTRLIVDGLFIGIRDLLLGQRFLRLGNTATNRALAAQVVNQYLIANDDKVEPVELPSGNTGYGVTVTPSNDLKSFTVYYTGQVVRGTNVIKLNGTLTIPVSSVGSGS